MTAPVAPVRMSHSRGRRYGQCGWAYKLGDIDGHKGHPSVAQAGGGAFHTWTEDYDMDGWFGGAAEMDSFATYLEFALAQLETESGIPRSEFRVSGRKTKDRPTGEDIDHWSNELGPQLCQAYADFTWPDGWTIAEDLPEDSSGRTVGIEYRVELADPLWQGYYDRIMRDRRGNLIVVDLKSWQRRRLSSQLQEYMVAGQLFGLRTVFGAYYHARKGELDSPSPCKWGAQEFRTYVELNQLGIESGLFVPTVGDHCGWCSMRENCVFAP